MNLTLQTISSPIISEILSNSTLDGVVLDKEHGVFGNLDLVYCIQVIKSNNKKCFVRVTNLDKHLVRMCLDNGVDGLIFSTVNTFDYGKEIIDFCKYPSFGGSRGQGLVRENKWGKQPLGNQQPILIAQIETKESVDNLSSIIECCFDYYIIGPYDLSASLGVVGEWNNELYLSYYNKIANLVNKDKLGVFLPSGEQIDNHDPQKEESQIVVWGMDALFISERIQNIEFKWRKNERI